MEETRIRGEEDRRGSPRGRAVFLALVPSAFLAAAYFLFVEHVLDKAQIVDPELRLSLRFGGLALTAISLVLAAACGYLLAERFLRPLRLLLRLAESGEMQPNRAQSLGERGREYFDLHRLLRVLVNQNKAGARAMEELEQLRSALAQFREEFSRTGLHGIPPEVTVAGPVREVAVHVQARRNHLLSFFRDLRERVGRVRIELERLGATLELGEPALEPGVAAVRMTDAGNGSAAEATATEATATGAAAPVVPVAADSPGSTDSGARALVAGSVERLRQLGTILALESSRAGGRPARRAAEMLDRFHAGLGELEAVLTDFPRPGADQRCAAAAETADQIAARVRLRERWRRVLEGIESIERRLDEVKER